MSIFANWFRRLFGSGAPAVPVPEWAGFFSPEQYGTFLRLVEGYFRKRGSRFTIHDGVVYLEKHKNDEEQQLGLLNLAQMCAQATVRDWPAIIEGHFGSIERSRLESEVLSQRLSDFEQVAELLAVRLWHESFLDKTKENDFVYRYDLEGTVSTLVFDLPNSIQTVSASDAKEWGRSNDELFQIALENVRENCIPDHSVQDIGDGIEVHVLADESFFVASHILLLDDHPELVGPHGSLVGIPHRHILLSYPIEDLNVILAVNKMIGIVHGMEKEGPGSISPLLYWYDQGSFTNLPYRIEDRKLTFIPPPEFVELLNSLGGTEPGEEES